MLIEDKFKYAEELWDLERLYADLATVKGKPLTRTEKLHLRGLLCGYSPSILAKKLHKSPRGLQSDLSSTVNQYVKSLIDEDVKLNNSQDIGNLLEEVGYKKVPTTETTGNLTLSIEHMESLIKINNAINKNKSVTVEINIRLVTSLPVEQVSKLLSNPLSSENREDPDKLD